MLNSLRPESFKEFIGQEKIVSTLKVIIESSQKRRKQLDHLLFHGSAGLGKTTLANVIAREMGANIRYAQGPLLEKKSDLLTLFASITEKDILFIDEIHGINKNAEELLYSALEDGVIDVMIGPDGDQKLMRMKLPKFTLIGATTKYSKISRPLRDRFGYTGKLSDYNLKEMCQIVKNSAKKLKIKIDEESIKLIAENSRFVPRVANNLLKRVNDFKIVKSSKNIEKSIIFETFSSIGVFKLGLLEQHIEYLKILINHFDEKWAAIDTISGLLNIGKYEVEKDIEPLLIANKLIEKGSRGRRLTNEGIQYLTTYNI